MDYPDTVFVDYPDSAWTDYSDTAFVAYPESLQIYPDPAFIDFLTQPL